MKLNANDVNLKCSWSDCVGEGKFPAPKSPENRNDRYFFCLEHIREYNSSWDFFRKMNMDEKQIDNFQKENLCGHRPTWKFGVNDMNYNNMEEIRNQVFGKFHGASSYQNKPSNNLSKQTRDALKTLGLEYPVSLKEIKQKYKKLAKAHHPDSSQNKNDDKIKLINQAYSYLKRMIKD